MYNPKYIQFAGKHDFDAEAAKKYAVYGNKTFSVNIFKWGLKANGKSMKPLKCVVRVHGNPDNFDAVIKRCEEIVVLLDNNEWHGAKSETVK